MLLYYNVLITNKFTIKQKANRGLPFVILSVLVNPLFLYRRWNFARFYRKEKAAKLFAEVYDEQLTYDYNGNIKNLKLDLKKELQK